MRKITLEAITRKLYSVVYYIINQHQYAHLSKTSRIYNPLKIQGKKNIQIHSNTTIGYKVWLEAGTQTGHTPHIEVLQGATIGNFNHIYATKSIILEKNVLTADRVYISDNLHSFENIESFRDIKSFTNPETPSQFALQTHAPILDYADDLMLHLLCRQGLTLTLSPRYDIDRPNKTIYLI